MAPIWNRYVESAAERYGVPPSLINSVIRVESGGQPGAVSGKGAGGYMQLMPDTFEELRRKHGFGPDRMDPETNINAGSAYMAQLYQQFGNWNDAVAAYNAGPNRWRQVKAGEREAPRETQSYVPKVLAGFQEKGTDVPLFSGQRAATEDEAQRWMNSAMPGGLLEFGRDKNFYDGLGLLNNAGQTESQPSDRPWAADTRTDAAAMPGTTQTERLDVSGRINELLSQYMKQPQQPASSPLQYALAGMSGAVQPLAGVHDRKVGIGEMLGALGGGLTRGNLAGDEARQQRIGGELDKLLKVGAYGNQSRTAELNETNSLYDNQYKQAMTKKALKPESDPKVVGKGVYVNGKWEAAPWANTGSDGAGPLEGTGIDAQMTNVYVTLSQKRASGQPLTPQETVMLQLAERHLTAPKMTMTPEGYSAIPAQPLPRYPTGTQPPGGTPAAAPPPGPPTPTVLVPNKPPQPTNEQNLNAGFANRLNAANSIFDTLETKGYDVPSKYDTTVGQLPGVGNYLTSDQYKSLEQAQREFITAQLRRESGAAISESEFETARKLYFPQPGDSPEVIAQKRKSREMAVRNMVQSSGPAKTDVVPRKVEDAPNNPSRAVNPTTGETIEWNGSEWVPVK